MTSFFEEQKALLAEMSSVVEGREALELELRTVKEVPRLILHAVRHPRHKLLQLVLI